MKYMSEELADEIFRLSIETTQIENRKWEIIKHLRAQTEGEVGNWDNVATMAMKFKMEKSNVNA